MTTSTVTLTHHSFAPPGPSQQTSQPPLPAFSSLQTWVHRPQAVAKCFVSDVYALRALIPGEFTLSSYASRGMPSSPIHRLPHSLEPDIFLLANFPCKMVDLVGWVAGVDQKESSMVITRPSPPNPCGSDHTELT